MSIIEQAKSELAAINFGEEDSAVMIGILEKFFDRWDSGGAVHVVAPVLTRLISGQPLGLSRVRTVNGSIRLAMASCFRTSDAAACSRIGVPQTAI